MQISCNEIVGSEVAQIKTFYSHVIGSMEGHDYVGIIFIYDFIEKLILTSRKKNSVCSTIQENRFFRSRLSRGMQEDLGSHAGEVQDYRTDQWEFEIK